jgi:hypothetical protein
MLPNRLSIAARAQQGLKQVTQQSNNNDVANYIQKTSYGSIEVGRYGNAGHKTKQSTSAKLPWQRPKGDATREPCS